MFDGLFWLSDSRSVADRRDTSGRASFYLLFFFQKCCIHTKRWEKTTERQVSASSCGSAEITPKDTRREGRKSRGAYTSFADVDVWKNRFLNVSVGIGRGGESKERRARVRRLHGRDRLVRRHDADFFSIRTIIIWEAHTFWWMMNWARTNGWARRRLIIFWLVTVFILPCHYSAIYLCVVIFSVV